MTKKKPPVSLTEKNKRFWKLPPQKQRVAIAKDVISQLSGKFYTAKAGSYFYIRDLRRDIKQVPEKLDSLFNELKAKKATCQVCGIGGCFTSLIRLGNNVPTEPIFNSGLVRSNQGINDLDMRPQLEKVFPSSQITLIECAFEEWHSYQNKGRDTRITERKKAADFGRNYEKDKDRLIAIMKNIIKNKGTFKP